MIYRTAVRSSLFAISVLVFIGALNTPVLAVALSIQRVSEGGTSGSPVLGDASSQGQASLSSDGRFVAYMSGASNIVPGDTNGAYDIFVMDRNAHTVSRVSEGGTSGSPIQGNNGSTNPHISADGRYVVFQSNADNLVAGDTNNTTDVFLMDTTTHTVSRVSEGGTSGSPIQGNNGSISANISGDGRYVAFQSSANNLVAGDTNNMFDIFVMEWLTHTLSRVSEGGTSGSPIQGNFHSMVPAISYDGGVVVFQSSSTNLVTGDTNGSQDIFAMERLTHTLSRVSEGGTSGSPLQANSNSYEPAISANGLFISFSSDASNLVGSDTNSVSDIFRMDLNTHVLIRVSEGGSLLAPIQGGDNSYVSSLSADGQYIAYESYAINLSSTPGFTGRASVYVTDANNHVTQLVSQKTTGGVQNNDASRSSISSDGKVISFQSSATDLVSGAQNGFYQLYVANNPTLTPPDDGDNVTFSEEEAAPNTGDANHDGTQDSEQANISSILSPVSGNYVVLESTCSTNYNVQIGGESSLVKDLNYDYPAGLIRFNLLCGTPGTTATVTHYYFGNFDLDKLVLRKSKSDGTYVSIPGATFSSATIGGELAVKVVYQITDGSNLDDDGIVDGNILDPSGLAVLSATNTPTGAPDTGFEQKSLASTVAFMISGGLLLVYSLNRKH